MQSQIWESNVRAAQINSFKNHAIKNQIKKKKKSIFKFMSLQYIEKIPNTFIISSILRSQISAKKSILSVEFPF